MRNFIQIVEDATREADDETVFEIIHEFADTLLARMESGDTPYNEVYAEDNQPFPQLFMTGYSEDGFSKEVALEIIAPLVDRLKSENWFLAKHFEAQNKDHDDDDSSPEIMIFFGFFPQRGRKEMISRFVYHISPKANREMIARDGIRAQQGGTDFIHTDSGRVYVILDQDMVPGIEADIRKHRGHLDPKWSELDVWEIDAWSLPEEWHVDLELEGVAAWTPNDIPVAAIALV